MDLKGFLYSNNRSCIIIFCLENTLFSVLKNYPNKFRASDIYIYISRYIFFQLESFKKQKCKNIKIDRMNAIVLSLPLKKCVGDEG